MKASILAVGMLVAAGSFVTTSAVQAEPKKAAASHASTSSGTIEKYDQGSRTLVLKHEGKEMTFVLGEHVNVMQGKQKGAIADITAGRAARVDYTVAGTTKTVSLVDLESATAKATAKSPPKK